MLLSLYIKNFALIDDITVNFDRGLNVLTGETGAGKSIILDALQVALGGRASGEYIRAGEGKAVVQAAFLQESRENNSLTHLGIEPSEDGVLVLAREISLNGRNICRVNGQTVSLNMYREAGEGLVDMHSQHQQQSLLQTERHLNLLDSYGGDQLEKQQKKVKEFFFQWQKQDALLQNLQNNARNLARQTDLLKYQSNEISQADLTSGEDLQLENERIFLANAEKITDFTNKTHEILYSNQYSAVESISKSLQYLKELSQLDKKFEPMVQNLENAFYIVEDVARDASLYLDAVEFDPQRLNYIEQRMDEINRLKRKYGNSVDDILAYHENIIKQLENISYSEEEIDQLKLQLQQFYQLWVDDAEKLSEMRKTVALELERAVAKELQDLEMGKVLFKVGFNRAEKPDAKGIDKVEFLMTTNPGEPLKPLSKIASGGELSRFMLAIRSLQASLDAVGTLIFDEIDTGVGGMALHAIGEKMAQIAQNLQVITVTHAAQVACFAHKHYQIRKKIINNKTYTNIIDLDEQGRINEIARMLGGKDITGVAREHALVMLAEAKVNRKI